MNNGWAKFIISGRFADVSAEAFRVYSAFRSDIYLRQSAAYQEYIEYGKLVSGLSVQDLAMWFGSHEGAILQAIDELQNLRWIDVLSSSSVGVVCLLGYSTGYDVKWLVDMEGHVCETVIQVREQLDKRIEKSTEKIKEIRSRSHSKKCPVVSAAKPKVLSDFQRIFNCFMETHESKYDDVPPSYPYRDTDVPKYGTRAYKIWQGKRSATKNRVNALLKSFEDVRSVQEYLEYVYGNWEELLTLFPNYRGPVVDLPYISNRAVIAKIRGCMISGIPKPKKSAWDGLSSRGTKTDWAVESDDAWK